VINEMSKQALGAALVFLALSANALADDQKQAAPPAPFGGPPPIFSSPAVGPLGPIPAWPPQPLQVFIGPGRPIDPAETRAQEKLGPIQIGGPTLDSPSKARRPAGTLFVSEAAYFTITECTERNGTNPLIAVEPQISVLQFCGIGVIIEPPAPSFTATPTTSGAIILVAPDRYYDLVRCLRSAPDVIAPDQTERVWLSPFQRCDVAVVVFTPPPPAVSTPQQLPVISTPQELQLPPEPNKNARKGRKR
jgi:hypothetical protein